MTRPISALERHGLSERVPSDRVKFLVSREIRSRKNVPLRRQFFQKAQAEFLGGKCEGTEELFRFLSLPMTTVSLQKLKAQMEKLADEWARAPICEQGIFGRKNLTH